MTRRIGAAAALLACFHLVPALRDRSEPRLAASEDPHAYFQALTTRQDHWRSYSFRSSPLSSWVTYSPSSDTNQFKQDGAKVVIPAFRPAVTVLTQSTSASDTILTVEQALSGTFQKGRTIRVDREIMAVTGRPSDTTVAVTRAQYGTAAASHVAGAAVDLATNSLPSQVRVPIETSDGHDYFFVWDAYWTSSFMGVGVFNHKAFQFSSGGGDGDTIWLEPQVTYGRCDPSVHVGSFQVRSYNKVGGDADWTLTDGNMLGPTATVSGTTLGPRAQFCIEPNTWVRFFLRIKQRANDYDYVDMWVADERREAVHVLMNPPVSVRPTGKTPNSIAKFWIEFNSSSTAYLRPDGRDLVAYVRNFVALRDVRDLANLLVRPVPGAQPATGPRPPSNLRIVR